MDFPSRTSPGKTVAPLARERRAALHRTAVENDTIRLPDNPSIPRLGPRRPRDDDRDPRIPSVPRKRVLLIDDSSMLRAGFTCALDAAGFETMAVGDATAALDAVARHRFDIVIADYQLGGTTGLELLAMLRNADDRLALILYSGL